MSHDTSGAGYELVILLLYTEINKPVVQLNTNGGSSFDSALTGLTDIKSLSCRRILFHWQVYILVLILKNSWFMVLLGYSSEYISRVFLSWEKHFLTYLRGNGATLIWFGAFSQARSKYNEGQWKFVPGVSTELAVLIIKDTVPPTSTGTILTRYCTYLMNTTDVFSVCDVILILLEDGAPFCGL